MVNRKGGRVLRFREKLTQLAETRREKMIDEKMRLHPSLERTKRNWILRLPIQRTSLLKSEQFFPAVILCGWLFCGFLSLLDEAVVWDVLIAESGNEMTFISHASTSTRW